MDPSNRRLREAFKRIQLLGTKPGVARRPFAKAMLRLQALHNHPLLGPILGPLMLRVIGVDPDVLARLYSDADARRVAAMSFDELADDALAAKRLA